MLQAKHGGADDLVVNILIRAIQDIQILTDKGFIRDGENVYDYDSWPKLKSGQNKVIINHYRKPNDIVSLVEFFTKHEFQSILKFIDCGIDPETIVDAVMDEELIKRVLAEYDNGENDE